ncbi:MAG: leucine-rich repeat domain-containing protein [Lachnospiraceae bacterium]|nr:leucine-rich repeat domain-containing protein [Lachnospiraceae bacterium]
MKRILFVLMLIFFALPLTARAGDEDGQEEPAPVLEEGPGRTLKIGERLIPLHARSLDLSGIDLSACDMDKLFAAMDRLEKIVMIDCGLDNEGYARLQDAHPGVRIIWEIKFSRRKLRTDAVGFSTFRGGDLDQPLSEKDAYYLRYCRDMVGLDLGHNAIYDFSFLQYMHELQVFIMVDNPGLCDISMLKYAPQLRYLEIFKNSITDLEALKYLEELEDLNFSRNPVADISPIEELPKLRRVTFMETAASTEDIAALRKKRPGVKIVTAGINSLAGGWREDEHYYAMRRLLKNNEENSVYHRD